METEPKKRNIIFRSIDFISDIGGWIASTCLFVLMAIVVLEVFMRYVFNSPTTWVGEVSIYLCMAVGLVGAAYALKLNMLFGITDIVDRLSAKTRRQIRILTNILGVLYSIVFIVKGIDLAKFSYELDDVSTGLLATPLWIPNLMIPIGGALLAVQFINKVAEDFQNKHPE